MASIEDGPYSDQKGPSPQTGVSSKDGSKIVQMEPVVKQYSTFTASQKRATILSGSFLGLISYMGDTIIYPALNQISHDLHVSNSKINLTITVFLIAQGVTPMVIAGFSERAGRRPAYIICFIFSIAANLGLALQNDYTALLVLRILQAAGSCGSISQGLVGDMVVSAERGTYTAYASVTMVLGPSLSPILGGLISQYIGWHWIFWVLLILAVATFIPLLLFFPETCRQVVADGSIPPPWMCNNVSDWIRFRNRAAKGVPIDREKQAQLHQNYRLAFPNFGATFNILLDKMSSLFLICASLALACEYAILTGLSKNFQSIYHFSNVRVSLVALAMGGGSIVSSFTTGRLLDWNYRRLARRHGISLRKGQQTDLSDYPIEKARLQIGQPLLVVAAAGVLGFGWSVDRHTATAAPIIFIFISGYGIMGIYQVLNVLMADTNPGNFAVAAAARNVYVCLVGAAASAVIDPMSDAMGIGWAYTVFAALLLIGSLGPLATMRYGMKWRQAKRERDDGQVLL